MKVLITGCAGFIGFHTTLYLLKKKINVIGIDNLDNYYDTKLKKNRLEILKQYNTNFNFIKIDISKFEQLKKIIGKLKFNYIIHLAAQAGVRYSIDFPDKYKNANLVGFFNISEIARLQKVKHFIFASTSSVYGETKKFPSLENDPTNFPLSFYAATKKSNEIMAHSYSNIYRIPITGLRFFTVYGPYGRPDMALYKFTKAIIESKSLDLFNRGDHIRDFTYIDDVVKSIYKLIKKPSKNKIPFEIYNVCSNNPVNLKKYLITIEKNLQKKAIINYLKMQKGDVHKTHGSSSKLSKKTSFYPKTSIEEGIKKYIKWYISYYKK